MANCFVIGSTRVLIGATARLIDAGVRVEGVLSSDPAVRHWAGEQGVRVLDPRADLVALLTEQPVDYLFSVVNFRILSAEVLALPRVAAINFHDGPLPTYSGSHVPAWALFNGERKHAATWHVMAPEVDAGPVLLERWFPIREHSTALSLTYEAAEVGAELFADLVPHIVAGTLPDPIDTSDRTRGFYLRSARMPGLIHAGTDAAEAERISKAMDFGSFPNPLGIPALVTDQGAVLTAQVRRIPRDDERPDTIAVAATESALKLATPDADLVFSDFTDMEGATITGRAAAQRLGISVGAKLPPASPDRLAAITEELARLRKTEPWWRKRLADLKPAPVPAVDFSAATSHYTRYELAYTPASRAEREVFTAAFLTVLAEHMGASSFDFGWSTSHLRTRAEATHGLAADRVPVRFEVGADLSARFAEAEAKHGYATDLAVRMGLAQRPIGADGPTFTRIMVLERGSDEEASAERDTEFALLSLSDGPPVVCVRETAMSDDEALDFADRVEELALDRLRYGDLAPGYGTLSEETGDASAGAPGPASVLGLISGEPGAIAVRTGRGDLTYAELASWSDSIAAHLYSEGIGEGCVVGVLTERGPELLPAMLGVLKAGAAFLPLDANYPVERLSRYVEVSECDLILTDAASLAFGSSLGRAMAVPADDGSALAVPPPSCGDDLAYVLFTSGSTGEPKGVEIQHAALANFLAGIGPVLGVTAEDQVLAHTTTAFDISLLELLLPLTVGATVVLASRDVARDPHRLAELASWVTVAQATPSLWRLLLDTEWTPHADLTVYSGGEALPPAIAKRLLSSAKALWNLYGPTEATIWVSTHKVESVGGFLPLGAPLPGVALHVLDDSFAESESGELYLSGAQLARGYINRPERTAEVFVTHPSTGERLYRTGDVVRRHPDGAIEWLGRADGQVKVRGNRIETGEIEAVLEDFPGISAAVVVAVPFEDRGDPRLTAYLISDTEPAKSALDTFLAERLPDYMVPSNYVRMATLPLTDNGKVARKQLPTPTRSTILRTTPQPPTTSLAHPVAPAASTEAAPTTSFVQTVPVVQNNAVVQDDPIVGAVPAAADGVGGSAECGVRADLPEVICRVFASVLGGGEFGVQDNFFDLGGDSANVTLAATALSRELGIDVSPPSIFATGTPAKLAKLLGHVPAEARVSGPPPPGYATQAAEVVVDSVAVDNSVAEQPRGDELAVIGIACRFPGASTPDEFWANLATGVSSIGDAPEGHRGWAHLWTDADEIPAGWVDGVEYFDPARFNLTDREARRLDPLQRMLLSVTDEAMESAGHDATSLGANTGVFIGTIASDFPELVAGSVGYADPHVSTGTAISLIANRLSHTFDWSGASFAIDTACSSSLVALHQAALALRAGEIDAAVVGAANVVLTPHKTRSFVRSGMLSPTGVCRTFDQGADGYVRGEGCGVLVIKRLADAERDGDPVLAVVRGTAVNHTGGSAGFLTAPSAVAQEAVVKRALAASGIDGSGVGYVEAHGTGTQLGDLIELEALRASLAGAGYGSVAVGSVKTNIGHLEPAAGIAGLIKAVLALQAEQIPPSLNLTTPNKAFAFEESPLFVPDRLTPWTGPKVAGVSSFGFGGANAHAVLAAAPKPQADQPGPYLLTLSAGSAQGLRTLADRLVKLLRAPYCPPLAALCAASQERPQAEHRLACVVDTVEQLDDKLMLFLARVDGARLHVGTAGDKRPALPALPEDASREVLEEAAKRFTDGADLPVRPRSAGVRFPTAPHAERYLWLTPAEEPRGRTWTALPEADEHVVQGKPTLPGAAYPGKVAEALGRKRFSIRDLTFRAAVVTPTTLTAEVDGASVVFRDGSGAVVCTTKVDDTAPNGALAPPELSFTALDLDEVYRAYDRNGLAYGPGYRCVTSLATASGHAVGTIRTETARGLVDARLLDGAFQVALAACGAQGLYVPFAIERLTVHGRVPETARVYARQDRAGAPGAGLITASLVVLDGDVPVLEAHGVTWKRVSPATTPTPAASAPAPLPAATNGNGHTNGHVPKAPAPPPTPPAMPTVGSANGLVDTVAEWVARALETDLDALELDRPLEEQGLDSMLAVSLAQDIRAKLGVDIPVTLVLEVGTVEGLVAELQETYGVTAPNPFPSEVAPAAPISPADSGLPLTVTEPEPEPVPQPATTGHDIAIIGFDGVFPNAENPEELWQLVLNAEDALTEVPEDRWDLSAYYSDDATPGTVYLRRAGFIDDLTGFDAGFFRIAPSEAQWIDPQQRHLIMSAWRAMEDAGVSGRIAGRKVGVFVGASYQHYRDQVVGDVVQTAAGLGNHNAILANRVSYFLDLAGPSMTIDTLCSSSLVALHTAVRSLREGECEQAVVSGVHMALSPQYFQLGSRLRSFSPTGASRAFDSRADGFVPGEGVVTVILKPLADALRDGDRVRAVVKGTAVNHGGRTSGLTVPSSAAQQAVISSALADAGIDPATIGMMEAHGTGTSLGDPIEIEGLTKAWRKHTDRVQFCAIGSLKSNIGHLEPAAGLAGLVKVLLAMEHKQIPPTAHVVRPNDHIQFESTPFYLSDRPTAWRAEPGQPRRAAVSAFGMGGVNAHVILEEPPTPAPRNDLPQDSRIVRVSGATEQAVRELAGKYAAALTPDTPLGDFAYTANVGRAEHRFRAAARGGTPAELAESLSAIADGSAPVAKTANKRAPVAFLFTGQGSQYPDMGRGLYLAEPVFREAIDECAQLLGRDLVDLLYGESRDELTHTANAQPAIVSVQVALVRLLASWGIAPDVVAGHSVGELTAAHAAGALALPDLLALTAERGRLMQAQPSAGGMAVVYADGATVHSELAGFPGVEVAAYNSAKNTTVSGPTAALEAYLAATAHRSTKLTVSHAFHSAMMEGALPGFADAVARVGFGVPTIPIASTLTGTWHTEASITDGQGWASAIRLPVRFTEAVTALHAAGARAFWEIGPHPVLTPLAQSTLPADSRYHHLLRRNQPDQRTLHTNLADYYSQSAAAVDWTAAHRGRDDRTTTIPTYPFDKRPLAAPQVQDSIAAREPSGSHPLFDHHYERLSEGQQ